MDDVDAAAVGEVPVVTVTDAGRSRQPLIADGRQPGGQRPGEVASGTVPTQVTRPAPWRRVVTAGQRPKCGWSYSASTSASTTVRPSTQRVAVAAPAARAGCPGGAQRDVAHQVAELLVPDARGLDESSGRRLVSRPGLVVGVAGARAEDQVAARLRVGGEPVERRVVGHVQRRDDQHRMPSRGLLRRRAGVAARVVQLAGVDDPHLAAGVERAAVEGIEDAVVGGRVRSAVGADSGGYFCMSHLLGVE